MTRQTPYKSSGQRSPSFPFITLEKALFRAQTLYDNEKRNDTPLPVAFSHWKYAPKSSGGQQTVGALKSYGLLKDIGKGEDRHVQLTDLALDILLDSRPNSEERRTNLREAGLLPKMIRVIKEKYPDHAPTNENLQWFLIKECGFTDSSAKQLSKIWNKNNEFIPLYEDYNSDYSYEKPEREEEVYSKSMTDSNSEQSAGFTPPMNSTETKQVGASIPVTGNCSMSVMADGPVTQEGIEKLRKYLDLIKDSFPGKDSVLSTTDEYSEDTPSSTEESGT